MRLDSDNKNPEVAIQSSIELSTSSPVVDQVPSSPASITPSLPAQFNPLANFTPEQIQQLAFLQYLQNFGGFNGFPNAGSPFNQPQEVITSSPVYRTETVFATSTIPLFLGAKKFFTTLTQSIGITTVTDYDVVTVSASQPGILYYVTKLKTFEFPLSAFLCYTVLFLHISVVSCLFIMLAAI